MDLLFDVVILLVFANICSMLVAYKLVSEMANRLQGPNVLSPSFNKVIEPTKVQPETEQVLDLEEAVSRPEILKDIVDNYSITDNSITEL